MSLRLNVAVCVIATLIQAGRALGADRAAAIAPDESYQSVLTSMAKASDRSDVDSLAERLVAMGDRDRLVEQVVWFAAAGATSPETRGVAGRVLARIDRPKEPVVRTLARLLDDPNAAVQAVSREMLQGYEDQSATRPPDFSVYRAVIEDDVRAKREPQASLVRHMYESDAGAALLTMVRAYQLRKPEEIKPILWGEHVVSDLMWRRRYGFVEPRAVDSAAVRELAGMAKHRQWWVRLYVAEIVRANPELGGAEVLQRFAGDGNALVRQAASRRQDKS